jgi:hypothetical protein
LIGIDMLFSTKQGFLCQFTHMGCRRWESFMLDMVEPYWLMN